MIIMHIIVQYMIPLDSPQDPDDSEKEDELKFRVNLNPEEIARVAACVGKDGGHRLS